MMCLTNQVLENWISPVLGLAGGEEDDTLEEESLLIDALEKLQASGKETTFITILIHS